MKKIFASLMLLAASPAFASETTFRLHLSNEPSNLDPNLQKTSSSSYVLGNLYRNIFTFDDKQGLLPELGNGCKRDKKKNLICNLKKDMQWSDGSPLTSEDFLYSYRKILDVKNGAFRADLLFKVKNAEAIYNGSKNINTLGITAPDKYSLKFEFETDDPDFEYNLASFLLAPTTKDLSLVSGPYKIKEWKKGQKLILEPNIKYKTGAANRPSVEFLFVEEDSTALQLYEKNQLQFLKRLPTLFIPAYKNRKDFYWIPVDRLDYVGFGPELSAKEDIRKALTYSLNFVELQKILSSEGKPGCVGLPDDWFPSRAPCFDFDKSKYKPFANSPTYTFMFSSLGGEDHKRATEWMQNQWKKNAGIETHLEQKENKVFLQVLRNQPSPLFRKGVSPDRPTCLAALETFSENSPENYIQLKSSEYNKILKSLSQANNSKEQKKWCLAGAEFLMKNHLLIPLGAIHFSILAKQDFKGWKLNQMNQLDLSNLQPSR